MYDDRYCWNYREETYKKDLGGRSMIQSFDLPEENAWVRNKERLEKVALDGSVECCAPPPRWCDLEL